jgi:hypothetical protein
MIFYFTPMKIEEFVLEKHSYLIYSRTAIFGRSTMASTYKVIGFGFVLICSVLNVTQ